METKMPGRRDFIKKAAGFGSLAILNSNSVFGSLEQESIRPVDGKILKINPDPGTFFKPLDEVTVEGFKKGTIVVTDGAANEYLREEAEGKITFKATGALGFHQVALKDKKGKVLDIAIFPVNCQTDIVDSDGEFNNMIKMLIYNMMSSGYNAGQVVRMNGKLYTYFSSWFQDHMYAMLGMRYFNKELKSGIDLYTDGQREDGMIHDNYKHDWDPRSSWIRRFDYGNFVKVPENPHSSSIYVRVPVENMAEFSYIEGVYLTWKATGDDAWMKTKLNSMLKAMNYTLTDPYRWSKKFNLTKRGYTIDIWDFQSEYDTKIADNDTMRVYLDKTKFGILYADNVRFAQSCMYLSKMLNYAGREEDAKSVKNTSLEIKKRIDDLSWNGEFYRHWVPEDPDFKRDFGGTDESRQVTMSNTWVLNRGLLSHEQVVSIIKTYQRIKKEMPKTSPGEWYTCYPPFEKGWAKEKWNYMNGGVSPIAAGELALGCFDHGYEKYGVDILRRVYKLSEKTGKIIHGCYKGAIKEEPERSFTSLPLDEIANADFKGDGSRPEGVMGWTNEGDNDLHEFPTGKQIFKDIPFDVIDPKNNGRRAVLALSGEEGYKRHAEIEVNQKAGSLYFLHCMGKGAIGGNITFHYADHSSVTKYITSLSGKGQPKSIGNWWQPDVPESRGSMQYLHTAWTGKNSHTPKVGVFIYGMNNPQPGKKIKKLEFEGQKDDSKWMIIGLTLSDTKVYFRPNLLSTIPKHWAASECLFGLMEGLAGVKNTGVAFDHATLAPRWEAAGKKDVKVTAKYEASGGYLSYHFNKKDNKYFIDFTGTAKETNVEVLLPDGKAAKQVLVNGKEMPFKKKQIEKGNYVTFVVEGVQANTVEITI